MTNTVALAVRRRPVRRLSYMMTMTKLATLILIATLSTTGVAALPRISSRATLGFIAR